MSAHCLKFEKRLAMQPRRILESPFSKACSILVLAAVLLNAIAGMSSAQTGVWRSGWGDRIEDAKRFVDSNGKSYTRSEILRMGPTKFAASWHGIYREPPFIYATLSDLEIKRLTSHLPSGRRATFRRFHKYSLEVADCITGLCEDGGMAGTALLSCWQELHVASSEAVYRCLVTPATSSGASPRKARVDTNTRLKRLEVLIANQSIRAQNDMSTHSQRWRTRHANNVKHATVVLKRFTHILEDAPRALLKAAPSLLDLDIVRTREWIGN